MLVVASTAFHAIHVDSWQWSSSTLACPCSWDLEPKLNDTDPGHALGPFHGATHQRFRNITLVRHFQRGSGWIRMPKRCETHMHILAKQFCICVYGCQSMLYMFRSCVLLSVMCRLATAIAKMQFFEKQIKANVARIANQENIRKQSQSCTNSFFKTKENKNKQTQKKHSQKGTFPTSWHRSCVLDTGCFHGWMRSKMTDVHSSDQGAWQLQHWTILDLFPGWAMNETTW